MGGDQGGFLVREDGGAQARHAGAGDAVADDVDNRCVVRRARQAADRQPRSLAAHPEDAVAAPAVRLVEPLSALQFLTGEGERVLGGQRGCRQGQRRAEDRETEVRPGDYSLPHGRLRERC